MEVVYKTIQPTVLVDMEKPKSRFNEILQRKTNNFFKHDVH